jgi:hypothetical protein
MTVRRRVAEYLAESVERWARVGVQSYQGGDNRDAFVRGVVPSAEAFFLGTSSRMADRVCWGVAQE